LNDRLTEREFWDAAWGAGGDPTGGDLRRWRSFADRDLWDRLLAPALTPLRGGRALEVGCAPGRNLLRLQQTFGLDPWGVEYAPVGVERTRQAFRAAGLDPAQVLEADFFDDAWLAGQHASFDTVVSFGFIEHFRDPATVVQRHVELLRPDGLLAVSLPNLRGLNGLLTRALHPALLPLHNLDLMTTDAVRALADPTLVDVRYAGPYGGLDVGMLTALPGPRRLALRGLRAVQWGVNHALGALPERAVPRGAWHSPGFVLIARRRSS
jgi:SAM-dependent methyltransferase